MTTKALKVYAPLMPHADRRRLIRSPITFRTIERKSWGGVLISRSEAQEIPVAGHRSHAISAEDESYLRYGRRDGETE